MLNSMLLVMSGITLSPILMMGCIMVIARHLVVLE